MFKVLTAVVSFVTAVFLHRVLPILVFSLREVTSEVFFCKKSAWWRAHVRARLPGTSRPPVQERNDSTRPTETNHVFGSCSGYR